MPTPRTRKLLLVTVAAVVVVGLAFVGVNLWLDSGDAPDAFTASESTREDDSASSPETTEAPAIELDGSWSIELAEGGDSGVGYRILEDVPIGGPEEVAGRTREVSGSMGVEGTTVNDLTATVQMASLQSDNALRDGVVASGYLQVDAFPTATVWLEQPVTIDLPAQPGELVDFTAPAQLTIHGVTQPVTVVGQGQWTGDAVEVVGTIDITLSQFGVERPNLAGRSARDEAVVEFKLRFVPSAT